MVREGVLEDARALDGRVILSAMQEGRRGRKKRPLSADCLQKANEGEATTGCSQTNQMFRGGIALRINGTKLRAEEQCWTFLPCIYSLIYVSLDSKNQLIECPQLNERFVAVPWHQTLAPACSVVHCTYFCVAMAITAIPIPIPAANDAAANVPTNSPSSS